MVDCLFLSTIFVVFINMEWQTRHRLRNNTDTGIYCRCLHGTSLVYPFPRCTLSKKETVGTACSPVCGCIPRFKYSTENSHNIHHTFLLKTVIIKAPTISDWCSNHYINPSFHAMYTIIAITTTRTIVVPLLSYFHFALWYLLYLS